MCLQVVFRQVPKVKSSGNALPIQKFEDEAGDGKDKWKLKCSPSTDTMVQLIPQKILQNSRIFQEFQDHCEPSPHALAQQYETATNLRWVLKATGLHLLTLSVHRLRTLVNSFTTRSTHFSDGSFNFEICFFTIASKAMSGVNSPTLNKSGENKEPSDTKTGCVILNGK